MKFRITYVTVICGIWLSLEVVFGQKEESPLLEALVPNIEQKNFKLNATEQNYTLFIKLPNGSTRTENVELRKPNTPEEELHVTGEIKTFYPDGVSKTIYEAGKNGYRVRFTYQYVGIVGSRLGAAALKSAAG